MAKKETEQRKKSGDYRKEYNDILIKVAGMESRIKYRTINLCSQFPDVMVDRYIVDARKPDILEPLSHSLTSGEFGVKLGNGVFESNVNRLLEVMGYIEEHIASLHPHQQQNLFN